MPQPCPQIKVCLVCSLEFSLGLEEFQQGYEGLCDFRSLHLILELLGNSTDCSARPGLGFFILLSLAYNTNDLIFY